MQYILTGEGRTVLDNQTAQPVKEEYFVKDHLGNVRSVIDVIAYGTAQYLATYEVASANLEGLLFENVGEIREDKPGSTNPYDLKSGRLNGSEPDRRIGTSLLVKVMAGDKINLQVNNYYDGYSRDSDQPVPMEDMLSNVIGTLTGGVGGFEGSESGNEALVGRLFTPENFTQLDDMIHTGEDPTKPKAYLNYVLFDENMKLVKEMSGAYQANGNGSWGAIGSPTAMTIPANGYLAVYLSNKTVESNCSTCGDVFFDQLDVQISKGNLLEETHYYPHGLPINGMGSAAAGFKGNRRKYQGNEYIKDINLNWMDFHARQYDPQIGRFLGVDPLADGQGQEIWSPYSAMGNAPESMVDPNGTDASYSGTEAIGMFVSLQNATQDFVFVDGKAMTASDYVKAAFASAINEYGGCRGAVSAMESEQTSFVASTTGGDGGGIEGVDYTFNGTTISNETIANGLGYNRIVTRKKGEVKGNVSIGDNYLNNQATAALASKYLFINFADGAIDVWFFLANRSRNEWTLTEFKLDNTVFSRITSVGNNMQGGGVMERQEVDGRNSLSYWISVHNHPLGGNGLSDNGNGMDDNTTIGHIRNTYYRGAQMNAYDYAHLADAYDFIKNNRK